MSHIEKTPCSQRRRLTFGAFRVKCIKFMETLILFIDGFESLLKTNCFSMPLASVDADSGSAGWNWSRQHQKTVTLQWLEICLFVSDASVTSVIKVICLNRMNTPGMKTEQRERGLERRHGYRGLYNLQHTHQTVAHIYTWI